MDKFSTPYRRLTELIINMLLKCFVGGGLACLPVGYVVPTASADYEESCGATHRVADSL